MVLTGGSPVDVREVCRMADAVVMAWYPGQEGGYALGDLLFGDTNFSGRLPVTFPADGDLLPPFEDYSMRGRTYRYFDDPLFAFGFGLSYTTFRVDNGRVEMAPEAGSDAGAIAGTLTCSVQNTGRRDGTETLQVYIRDMGDTDGPLKSLRAFQRVSVKAGQSMTVNIPLSRKAFEFWNKESNTMRIKSGRYEVLYGTSSRPDDLHALTVTLP